MDLRHFSKAGPRNDLKIFLRARCVSASRLRGARIEQSMNLAATEPKQRSRPCDGQAALANPLHISRRFNSF
jgi:hypothetical protein